VARSWVVVGAILVIVPEYPDITVYLEALEARVLGQPLMGLRLATPFLLRTVAPVPEGQTVARLRRVGKRIALGFESDVWMVLHLMVAGRLHWKLAGAKLSGRNTLAAFDFPNGTLVLTEAGSKRQASLHIVEDLASLDPGGVEVIGISLDDFAKRLRLENHTLKRSLTDPRLFSGIGNAYSDEILHAARLSPVALSQKLTDAEIERLWLAVGRVLEAWTVKLRNEANGGFPTGVTAFRPEMAAHGRFGMPCPDCGGKIQRIRYASNETNYCPQCQTGGRVLADRGLSRLLGADWPRSLEELERFGRA
jgi:formamidopyrimidine-DNA glycosylase